MLTVFGKWREFLFVLIIAGALVSGALLFWPPTGTHLLKANPQQGQQPLYKIGVFTYNSTVRSVVAEFKNSMVERAMNDSLAIRYATVDFSLAQENIVRAAEVFKEAGVDIIITGQSAAGMIAAQLPETPVIAAYAANMALAEKMSMESAGKNIVFIDAESPENSGERLRYLHRLLPKAKTVLVIRNRDGEPFANLEPMEYIRNVAGELGIAIVEKQFASRSELNRFFLEYDLGDIDAVFRYADTFVSENIDLFFMMLNQPGIRKPFVVRNRFELAKGGVLSYGFDVDAFGAVAADAAVRILTQKAAPDEISVIRPGKAILGINKGVAESFNVSVPDELIREADIVID